MPQPIRLIRLLSRGINATALICLALLCLPQHAAAATLAVGDTFVYQVKNGYNGETVGTLSYQATAVTAQRAEFLVTPDRAALGLRHTEAYTGDGLWLRVPLDNHGAPAYYDFATALPAYVFPLEPGKTWSVRLPGVVAEDDTRPRRSVRIDGRVAGRERVRVPAGEFDTVKIVRTIYAGDWDYFKTETSVIDIEWYSPELGRGVRRETRSDWQEQLGCRGMCQRRGDYFIAELITVPGVR